eukprot:SAG31_NODE_37952_length_300_cov_0.766169_1_plen_49_part_01
MEDFDSVDDHAQSLVITHARSVRGYKTDLIALTGNETGYCLLDVRTSAL